MASAGIMAPEGSGGLDSRTSQKRPLHGSLQASSFYGASPLPPKSFSPHRPSLLRHVSGPPAPSVSNSTFQIVIGPSPSKTPTSNAYTSSSTASKKRGRPFTNPEGNPNTQAMPKKKGRPFKTQEAAAAALAKASDDDVPKKRGRPFKYAHEPEQIDSVVPPEPKFVPFICEWKDCPAELHNLDTLRAHLLTVHLAKQPCGSSVTCLWKTCCQEVEAVDKETGQRGIVENGPVFKTRKEWTNHVEVVHLDPVARYQGDGPKLAMNFFAPKSQPGTSLSYLLYNDGRQVTPSLKNQPVEEGRAKDNNMGRFRKERDGLYVVLVPIDDPNVYMADNDRDDGDDVGDKDEA